VLTETSATWIDLNDELSFLHKSKEFVWASARDGFLHLYLYDYQGHLVRRLTEAPGWSMTSAPAPSRPSTRSIGRIYFSATEKSPVERQLYRTRSTRKIPGASSASPQEPGYTA